MQERFNKDLKEAKKSQYITNNAINEIKNTLEGTNNRITEAEDRISEVEDRMLGHLTLSQRSLRLSSFLLIRFSFFLSDSFISTILSSAAAAAMSL